MIPMVFGPRTRMPALRAASRTAYMSGWPLRLLERDMPPVITIAMRTPASPSWRTTLGTVSGGVQIMARSGTNFILLTRRTQGTPCTWS